MSNLVRKALTLTLFLGVSGSVLAGGAEQARSMLEQMASAMSQLSYQGTFVYVRNGVVETMRITHVQDENGVQERLYSVSGPRREVVRDRNGVRCILKGSSRTGETPVVADSYFPDLPPSLFDDKASGYRLETGGEARIAGQTARRVSITPEDDYRYGYDFWLQEGTGLLLKWVLLDSNHKALAKLMFTDFATGDEIDQSELVSDSPTEDFIELSKAGQKGDYVLDSTTPRWQPQKLPSGFQLTSHSTEVGANGSVEHSVYSDGLAAVSVYVEQHGVEVQALPAESQLGTNNVYSKQQDGLQITVIGEVPAITVKSIANEMALSDAPN